MSDDNNDNVVDIRTMMPAADSEEAEAAMEEEFMAEMGYMLVDPSDLRTFKFDETQINSIEDVRDFIREMGIEHVLLPGQTLEEVGRNPRFWIEIEEEDAEPTDI